MSNTIRYDALLTRDLAAELDTLLRSSRVEAILFDRERLRMALVTRTARRDSSPPPSLLWQLHPDAGHLTRIDRATATGSRVPLRAPSPIVSISAPPDERIIEVELAAGDAAPGATRRLIIELVTNQWNAIAIGADDIIVAVLRERTTRDRSLRPGIGYVRPPSAGRAWAMQRPDADGWSATLRSEPTGRRLAGLMKRAAYMSPLNAAVIVGDADVFDTPAVLERARQRYLEIVYDAPRHPALLTSAAHAQPYSVRLDPADIELPSLLDAFTRAAEQAAALPVAPATTDVALAAVAERLEEVEQRLRRLRVEQDGAAEEALRLRQHADLLLSQLHRVARGATEIELDDFAGGHVIVPLDPTLKAADNASKLYDVARKRARAAARIPAIVQAGERELARLNELAERIRSGTADDAELARVLRRQRGSAREAMRPLPYRVYRTTSGHELRVGRSARANDELTFHHSSPGDIWLHARDVAGAHVILRWPRGDENPSARDITEAAVLAALHSRARTSGTVAVDWTRRKYVRKPRKSGPGAVIPERVKTVFVEPDSAVEERLRMDA